MRTARSPTKGASVASHQISALGVYGLSQQVSLAGGPQVNKFEQVSSPDHQMTLAGGRGGGRGSCTVEARGSLYGEVKGIMRNGHIWPHTVDKQTHRTKNCTFQQLHWQAVKIFRHLQQYCTYPVSLSGEV